MANSAILAIKILADARGAQKGMAQAEKATSKWSSGMALASKAIGAVGIGAAVGSAVKGAADLAETMSKTETVFGSSAGEIKKWSETAAKAFGLSQQEALDAASSYQVMFTQLGIADGTSQDMSKSMIQAAGDLASFHNVAGGTAEVTDMLSSAMRGEYDSLQRLIPNINAAKVQQKAMATTHKKSAKDLTDAEKAAATYALILEGMGPAAGDYAKTANGAANSQRTLTKTMQDTSDSLGAALLPALQNVLGVANKFASWAKDNPKQLKLMIAAVGGLVVAVYAINAALKVYQATLVVIRAVQMATFLTNPVFLVIAAVVLLVAAVVLLWKRSKTFRSFVLGMWKAIRAATQAVANFFKQVWNVAFAVVKGYFNVYKTVVLAVFNAIKAAISAVTAFFKTVWNAALAVVKGYFNVYKAVVLAVFAAIRSAISTVTGWFKTAWNSSVGAVKAVFRGLESVITAPFDAVKGAVQTAIEWVQRLIDKISSIKMPDLTPGFSLPDINPFSAAPAPQLSAAAHTRAAPTAHAGGGGNTYIINGALDPEAVARQIKRIVGGHDRRVGTAQAI